MPEGKKLESLAVLIGMGATRLAGQQLAKDGIRGARSIKKRLDAHRKEKAKREAAREQKDFEERVSREVDEELAKEYARPENARIIKQLKMLSGKEQQQAEEEFAKRVATKVINRAVARNREAIRQERELVKGAKEGLRGAVKGQGSAGPGDIVRRRPLDLHLPPASETPRASKARIDRLAKADLILR
jgi:hypothetical protein